MNHIVIFDTEFTTWDGALARGWSGENEHREIVQLGAIKVDWPSGHVIDSLDLTVKPKINPILSDYFIDLTHITQKKVDSEGIPFTQAIDRFVDFCGENTLTLSYGGDDRVLAENIALSHCLKHNFLMWDKPEFVDCRRIFMRADPTIAEKKVNSGRIWQHYGLNKPHEADEHNALFDCYSILAGLKYLHENGSFDFVDNAAVFFKPSGPQ